MTDATTTLYALLAATRGDETASQLIDNIYVDPQLLGARDETATRGEIAMALNLLLLDDLIKRVPAAAAYLNDCEASGRKFVFDHGAIRTVDWPDTGSLPRGNRAFSRILEPLGYDAVEVYPLDRLGMTGTVFRHRDLAQTIPQFFVSELHPQRFSSAFQAAVSRVVGNSTDPLSDTTLETLEELGATHSLPFALAVALLPALVSAFARHHDHPALADYELLLEESAEMAWIATEGNVFNHATDRVTDIDKVAARQRELGRPIKNVIETSASGRVRQTAFRADTVQRQFRTGDNTLVERRVPGSFHEIIFRAPLINADGAEQLDLGFDSGNAQEIFRMTASARASEHIPSTATLN